jgi:hypothetical protein
MIILLLLTACAGEYHADGETGIYRDRGTIDGAIVWP